MTDLAAIEAALDAGDALRDLLAWADNVIRAHRFGPQKAVERARLALAKLKDQAGE